MFKVLQEISIVVTIQILDAIEPSQDLFLLFKNIPDIDFGPLYSRVFEFGDCMGQGQAISPCMLDNMREIQSYSCKYSGEGGNGLNAYEGDVSHVHLGNGVAIYYSKKHCQTFKI